MAIIKSEDEIMIDNFMSEVHAVINKYFKGISHGELHLAYGRAWSENRTCLIAMDMLEVQLRDADEVSE